MTSTAILTEDAAAIVSEEGRQFHWGATIAGAIAAIATTFFLLTLGSGVGLAISGAGRASTGTFLTLGAIYVFAAQAFGFAVGGYLVGRLIGPEVETGKEEEFRAAAHGLTVWGLAVIVGLLIVGATMVMPRQPAAVSASSSYWLDLLFRPASATPLVAADKVEVGHIWEMNAAPGDNADNARIAHLVSQDTGLSASQAMTRVESVEAARHQDLARKAKAAAYLALWTAFALLFGAIVAVAAAISARWTDDKISFDFRSRAR